MSDNNKPGSERRGGDLAELADTLCEAFGSPCRVGNDPTEHKRRQFICALVALAKFFDQAGLDRIVSENLTQLAGALAVLQDGANPAIFRPAKRAGGGRPPDGYDIWRARTLAAFGLRQLRDAEPSPKKAAKRAAALASIRFPELQSLCRTGDLESSMLSWLKAFENGTAGDEFAQSSFSENLAVIEGMIAAAGATPAVRVEAGNRLLKLAAQKAKNISETNPPVSS